MKSPFEILNIPERCTDEEAKAAYLERIRQYPPERFPDQFKEIKNAYDAVKTERGRIAVRLFRFDPFQVNELWDAIETEEARIPAEKLHQIISEVAAEHLQQKILEKITDDY